MRSVPLCLILAVFSGDPSLFLLHLPVLRDGLCHLSILDIWHHFLLYYFSLNILFF